MIKKLFLISLISLFFVSCSKDDNNVIDLNKISQHDSIKATYKKFADSIVNNTICPGLIVCVWENTKDFSYSYAAGKADISANIPMNLNHVFKVGSNTKTYVVTVLLQLIGEGKLKLDDTLAKFYPDLPKAKSITIRMLAQMTSGYESYTEVDAFKNAMKANPQKYVSPSELVQYGTSAPMKFDIPGESFYYSNTNTIIIGMIIEKITGNKLESEIKTRIFDRLGLSNSYFLTGLNNYGNYCHGYGESTDTLAPLQDLSSKYDASLAWSAGAISCDLNDAKTYLNALVKGTLINSELQKSRLDTTVRTNEDWSYSLGLIKYLVLYGHFGSLPGYQSIMMADQSGSVGIIIMYNTQSKACNPIDFGKFIVAHLPTTPY